MSKNQIKKPRKIGIYFNVEEYEKLKKLADQKNLSFGKFVKNAALENKLKVTTKKIVSVDHRLLFEFNKIGCNINQIARQLNKMSAMDNFSSSDTKFMFNNFKLAVADLKRDLKQTVSAIRK